MDAKALWLSKRMYKQELFKPDTCQKDAYRGTPPEEPIVIVEPEYKDTFAPHCEGEFCGEQIPEIETVDIMQNDPIAGPYYILNVPVENSANQMIIDRNFKPKPKDSGYKLKNILGINIKELAAEDKAVAVRNTYSSVYSQSFSQIKTTVYTDKYTRADFLSSRRVDYTPPPPKEFPLHYYKSPQALRHWGPVKGRKYAEIKDQPKSNFGHQGVPDPFPRPIDLENLEGIVHAHTTDRQGLQYNVKELPDGWRKEHPQYPKSKADYDKSWYRFYDTQKMGVTRAGYIISHELDKFDKH